jgi:hypothetical protein
MTFCRPSGEWTTFNIQEGTLKEVFMEQLDLWSSFAFLIGHIPIPDPISQVASIDM